MNWGKFRQILSKIVQICPNFDFFSLVLFMNSNSEQFFLIEKYIPPDASEHWHLLPSDLKPLPRKKKQEKEIE